MIKYIILFFILGTSIFAESGLIRKLKKSKPGLLNITLEQTMRCKAVKNVKWIEKTDYRGVKQLIVNFDRCTGIGTLNTSIYFTVSDDDIRFESVNHESEGRSLLFLKDLSKCNLSLLSQFTPCKKEPKKIIKNEVQYDPNEKIKIIDISKYSASKLNSLGYDFYKQKKYNNAYTYWKIATKKYPKYAMAHYNLACVMNLLFDKHGCSINDIEEINFSRKEVIKHLISSIKYKKNRFQKMQKDSDLESIRDTFEYQKLLGSDLTSKKEIQRFLENVSWERYGKQNDSEYKPHYYASIEFKDYLQERSYRITNSSKKTFFYTSDDHYTGKNSKNTHQGIYYIENGKIILMFKGKYKNGKIVNPFGNKKITGNITNDGKLVFANFNVFKSYIEPYCEAD